MVELKELVSELIYAKHEEEEAKVARIAIEEKIAALIPGPERGSKTVTLEDGTKITIERGFSYKADIDKIFELMSWDGKIPPIKTKTTRELDENGYEWYRENDKDLFEDLSKYVTVKPKKTSISIKAKK